MSKLQQTTVIIMLSVLYVTACQIIPLHLSLLGLVGTVASIWYVAGAKNN